MMDGHDVTITLDLQEDYKFIADFGVDGVATLLTDEPPPLGTGAGPNPSRMLATAVGNCLGASLLFCLRKARIEVNDLRVTVTAHVERNEQKRLRITGMDVRLAPDMAAEDRERAARCLEIFEDFCLVTQSVRGGIDIAVAVEPAESGVPT